MKTLQDIRDMSGEELRELGLSFVEATFGINEYRGVSEFGNIEDLEEGNYDVAEFSSEGLDYDNVDRVSFNIYNDEGDCISWDTTPECIAEEIFKYLLFADIEEEVRADYMSFNTYIAKDADGNITSLKLVNDEFELNSLDGTILCKYPSGINTEVFLTKKEVNYILKLFKNVK